MYKVLLCRIGVLAFVLESSTVMCRGIGSQGFGISGQEGGGLARQSWSTEQGLPQNSVHAILQTRDGFLWIATEGGLARFDGVNFRVFAQANEPAFTSDDVCCLAEDTRNALWIGTSDGLLRKAGDGFKRFGVDDGMPSATILDVVAGRDGSILALTTLGVARADIQGKITTLRVPGNESVLAVSRSADGEVWVVTTSEVLRYQGGELRHERSLPPQSSGSIGGLAVVPGEQAVWLRTVHDVTLLRGEERHTWSVGRELPGTRIESMSADSNGAAWIGTNRGLVSIDPRSRVSGQVSAAGPSSVLSTAEDRDGDRWVGTETGGLEVLRRQPFRSEPGIADEAVTAVVETSDGDIWLATREDGLWRVRSGAVERAAVSARLASRVVLALSPGMHGDLWVGTPDGLNHVDGDIVRTYTSANGLPDDFIRSLLADSDGTVWAGTRRGLVRLDGVTGKVLATYTHRDGLGSDSIGALLRLVRTRNADGSAGATRSDDLWIATFDGLSRLRDGKISTFTKADGLSGNVITSLAADDSGALWIGTRAEGLTRYSAGVFTAFRQEGLPNDIDSILPDGQGRLWMGTRHGVAQVSIAVLERLRSRSTLCRWGVAIRLSGWTA